jgi:hypothetical protein
MRPQATHITPEGAAAAAACAAGVAGRGGPRHHALGGALRRLPMRLSAPPHTFKATLRYSCSTGGDCVQSGGSLQKRGSRSLRLPLPPRPPAPAPLATWGPAAPALEASSPSNLTHSNPQIPLKHQGRLHKMSMPPSRSGGHARCSPHLSQGPPAPPAGRGPAALPKRLPAPITHQQ